MPMPLNGNFYPASLSAGLPYTLLHLLARSPGKSCARLVSASGLSADIFRAYEDRGFLSLPHTPITFNQQLEASWETENPC
jgi:hypothetical protein